jgi:hypothetical protein
MAVMGRTLGIPSRVAVGFLRPDKVGENQYVYSAHDLHAWPEMYFDGVGWVRFEPTPDDRAQNTPGYTTAQFDSPEPTRLPSVSAPTVQPENVRPDRQEPEVAASPTGDGGSGGGGFLTVLLVALAAGGLALLPRAARTAVRRRRWAGARTAPERAEAAWRELRDVAVDLHLQWDDSVTLRTRARAIAGSFSRPGIEDLEGFVRGGVRGPQANPDAARALERVVRDVELARYSRASSVMAGRPAEAVLSDVDVCAEALHAGATKKRRRLATWLPASLVRNGVWRTLWTGRTTSVGLPVTEPGVDRAH